MNWQPTAEVTPYGELHLRGKGLTFWAATKLYFLTNAEPFRGWPTGSLLCSRVSKSLLCTRVAGESGDWIHVTLIPACSMTIRTRRRGLLGLLGLFVRRWRFVEQVVQLYPTGDFSILDGFEEVTALTVAENLTEKE